MSGRFIDFLRNLTAKSTTIDGSEQVLVDSSGLPQKATLSDVIRYGGGNSTRVTTIGNANISQKSDGAMWLEVTGQTAGNARGAGAFDWQAVRSNAARVASGNRAVAIGAECTASQAGAVAIGFSSSASNVASIALGIENSASGLGAFSVGGRYAAASNVGQIAFGFGHNVFWGAGANQANLQTLGVSTTDATSTQMWTDTPNTRMVIPATRSVAFTGIVQAMALDSGTTYKVKAWKIEGVITRDGSGNTRIVGTIPTPVVIGEDSDNIATPSTWAIASITADDTNDALAINVTGQLFGDNRPIRWQASLFYSQVGF